MTCNFIAGEVFGFAVLPPRIIHIEFAVDRFSHRTEHVLNRGRRALREFMRTPEESDFAIFEQAERAVVRGS